jgi:hypothetical protein
MKVEDLVLRKNKEVKNDKSKKDLKSNKNTK